MHARLRCRCWKWQWPEKPALSTWETRQKAVQQDRKLLDVNCPTPTEHHGKNRGHTLSPTSKGPGGEPFSGFNEAPLQLPHLPGGVREGWLGSWNFPHPPVGTRPPASDIIRQRGLPHPTRVVSVEAWHRVQTPTLPSSNEAPFTHPGCSWRYSGEPRLPPLPRSSKAIPLFPSNAVSEEAC